MKYGFVVVETKPSGAQTTTQVDGCSSLAEARERAFYFAKATGWKPPKWWQWWRWGDTRETDLEETK